MPSDPTTSQETCRATVLDVTWHNPKPCRYPAGPSGYCKMHSRKPAPHEYVCLCRECGEPFSSRQKDAKICIFCFGFEDGPYLQEEQQ